MATDSGSTHPSIPQPHLRVSGTRENPYCICQDFREATEAGEDYRCRHILAVASQLTQPTPFDEEEREERRAIQEEGAAAGQPAIPAVLNPGVQMFIKRSVSPDGRINSLSVEFSSPVSGLTTGAIKTRAAKTLDLQNEIVAGFLERAHGHEPENNNGNGHGNGHSKRSDQNGGPVAARMIDVRGMQTRYGWRMFINVQVNGQTYKLFGKLKELGEFICAAGYPDLSHNLSSSTELNIPCRVTFRASEDGRYQNVEEVLPADNGTSRGRSRK